MCSKPADLFLQQSSVSTNISDKTVLLHFLTFQMSKKASETEIGTAKMPGRLTCHFALNTRSIRFPFSGYFVGK